MDQENRIIALEQRVRNLENLIRENLIRDGTYEEHIAKIRDVINLRRTVEMEYVQKRDLADLVYTKEECDKQFRKRSTIDRILEKMEE